MNAPLPLRQISLPFSYQYRVMFLNPQPIYERIKVEAFKRRQHPKNIGMQVMFPKQEEKICGCGCGKKLEGRRTRWATDDCASFAVDVYHIIYGQPDVIRSYLKAYYGKKCKCGRVNKMKVDHITPVKHGGGGCWLSNYQFLCHACHVQKTNTDFGWKADKPTLKVIKPAGKKIKQTDQEIVAAFKRMLA